MSKQCVKIRGRRYVAEVVKHGTTALFWYSAHLESLAGSSHSYHQLGFSTPEKAQHWLCKTIVDMGGVLVDPKGLIQM